MSPVKLAVLCAATLCVSTAQATSILDTFSTAQAVPEPASVVLLAAGVALVAGVARRQRHRL
jgi:hypothetical protein